MKEKERRVKDLEKQLAALEERARESERERETEKERGLESLRQRESQLSAEYARDKELFAEVSFVVACARGFDILLVFWRST